MKNYQQKADIKQRQNRLPKIGNKEDRYNDDLKSSNSRAGMNKQIKTKKGSVKNNESKNSLNRQRESQKTLNVMNVTFNSRPGVSNYVMHLVGSGATDD